MSAGTVETLLHQAQVKSQQRDAISAVALYRQALAVDPDSADALEGLAMVFFQAGDFNSAIEKFVRLTQLQPQESRHYVNLGAIYNRLGQHQQAVEVLRKAIQRDRKCANAYYNLGIAQRKLGQQAMAISAYKEAIRAEPLMAEAYLNLANVYLESNNFPLAILNFNKALEIRPELEKARVGLSRAEDALEQTKVAKNPFGRLVDTKALEAAVAPAAPTEGESSPLDRHRVHVLSHELNRLTEEYRDLMKSQFEPRLHELQKVVAEGKVSGLALSRAVVEFQEWFALWQQLGREVHQRAEELRDGLAH